MMSTHMSRMTATGLDARPMPARRGAWAIYDVFQTAGAETLSICGRDVTSSASSPTARESF